MAQSRSGLDEWDVHKDEIRQLYIEDEQKLSDVMELMAQRRGFKRTKAQYEGVFRKWDLKKNNRKEDWRYIAEQVKDRRNQGLESRVKIRGVLVPESKVKKEISRYDHLVGPYRRPMLGWTIEPPHVQIYTPQSSPEPICGILESTLYWPVPVQISFSSDKAIAWAEHTPWYEFVRFIQELSTNIPPTLSSNRSVAANQCPLNSLVSAGVDPTETIVGRQAPDVQFWLDGVIMAHFVDLDPLLPAPYTTPNSYLPPMPDRSRSISMEDMHDITRRSTQLECIKYIVSLIANNHDTWDTIPILVEILRDRNNISVLKSFLDQNLLAIEAVAERLMCPAARYQNVPLLKVMVEHGMDLNLTERYTAENALAWAVKHGDEHTVTYLLGHGADTIRPLFNDDYIYQTSLDLAVECGNMSIIQDILAPRPDVGCGCPNITIQTLRLATLLGNTNIMNFLVNRNPALLDEARSEPWLLSEAAATHETDSTFTLLQDWGIDVAKSNDFAEGSSLAVACYYSNMPLARRLLDLGADIDSAALCRDHTVRTAQLVTLKLRPIKTKSALQVAVEIGHEELVQFLLAEGASPNRSCRAHPLQIAACRGPNTIVQMLIKVGANVNAVGAAVNPWYCFNLDGGYVEIDGHKPAVQIALESGQEGVVFALIEAGAEIPSCDPGVTTGEAKEVSWNPVLSAIIGRNSNLICYIAENAELHRWGTPECLARCVSNMGSEFTGTLTDRGVFSTEALSDPKVLCNFVFEGDTERVRSIISRMSKSQGLPTGYGAAGIALAVQLQKESMIRLFLDAGVKPYDPTEVGLYGMPKWSLGKGTSALREAFMVCGSRQVQPYKLWNAKMLLDECGPMLYDTKRIIQKRQILVAYGVAMTCRNLDAVRTILDTGLEVGVIDGTIGFGGSDQPRCTWLQCLFDFYAKPQVPVYQVAMALLEHGAMAACPAEGADDLNTPGLHTPLQYAAAQNQTLLVRNLLDMGADVNANPNSHRGATALQFAAINGNFEILNILLEAGANISTLPADYEGRSAIEGAAEMGRLDMVSYLLQAGANVQGRANKNYRRSVCRAWEQGHRCLARKIQDWKTDKFGAEDCESIDVIVESMTADEMDFLDTKAEAKWKEKYPSVWEEYQFKYGGPTA
ncbi:ankyrin [Lophiostoma macrostomum CBS 122681]|uniref:Ankyrin n=1 Tax=Lophiostoma macrostomum CBS 122681 TaxID=1314788 RepID=A0A6A6SWE6_9PLEO|nr:ankyrin [Lophiostoma macrostomum CBS 122681]